MPPERLFSNPVPFRQTRAAKDTIMASFNRVILMGNLTRDPELRYISTGTAVSDITLAVNDRIKRNNEWVEETSFVDVTLWGRTAEVANQYLSKGSPILIEGRLKQDRWEKEGQKFSKLRVTADQMRMLGSRGGGGGGGGGASGSNFRDNSQSYDAEEDFAPSMGPPANQDIPF
jgi:single-strand DNA-binding protein